MSSRRKFLLVFCFILLDMFLLVGFLVIRDATFLNDLKKEVDYLSKLDITNDNYNTIIKSKGTYAVLEGTIKEYLDNLASEIQDIFVIINDEEFTKLLSYENYSKDGPEFRESFIYINDMKSKLAEKFLIVEELLEEDKVANYINDRLADPYYVNLYRSLILNDNFKSMFNETKISLSKKKNIISKMLDTSSNVLNFLASNKDKWKLEDGEVKFLTTDLYNQYQAMISNLNS